MPSPETLALIEKYQAEEQEVEEPSAADYFGGLAPTPAALAWAGAPREAIAPRRGPTMAERLEEWGRGYKIPDELSAWEKTKAIPSELARGIVWLMPQNQGLLPHGSPSDYMRAANAMALNLPNFIAHLIMLRSVAGTAPTGVAMPVRAAEGFVGRAAARGMATAPALMPEFAGWTALTEGELTAGGYAKGAAEGALFAFGYSGAAELVGVLRGTMPTILKAIRTKRYGKPGAALGKAAKAWERVFESDAVIFPTDPMVPVLRPGASAADRKLLQEAIDASAAFQKSRGQPVGQIGRVPEPLTTPAARPVAGALPARAGVLERPRPAPKPAVAGPVARQTSEQARILEGAAERRVAERRAVERADQQIRERRRAPTPAEVVRAEAPAAPPAKPPEAPVPAVRPPEAVTPIRYRGKVPSEAQGLLEKTIDDLPEPYRSAARANVREVGISDAVEGEGGRYLPKEKAILFESAAEARNPETVMEEVLHSVARAEHDPVALEAFLRRRYPAATLAENPKWIESARRGELPVEAEEAWVAAKVREAITPAEPARAPVTEVPEAPTIPRARTYEEAERIRAEADKRLADAADDIAQDGPEAEAIGERLAAEVEAATEQVQAFVTRGEAVEVAAVSRQANEALIVALEDLLKQPAQFDVYRIPRGRKTGKGKPVGAWDITTLEETAEAAGYEATPEGMLKLQNRILDLAQRGGQRTIRYGTGREGAQIKQYGEEGLVVASELRAAIAQLHGEGRPPTGPVIPREEVAAPAELFTGREVLGRKALKGRPWGVPLEGRLGVKGEELELKVQGEAPPPTAVGELPGVAPDLASLKAELDQARKAVLDAGLPEIALAAGAPPKASSEQVAAIERHRAAAGAYQEAYSRVRRPPGVETDPDTEYIYGGGPDLPAMERMGQQAGNVIRRIVGEDTVHDLVHKASSGDTFLNRQGGASGLLGRSLDVPSELQAVRRAEGAAEGEEFALRLGGRPRTARGIVSEGASDFAKSEMDRLAKEGKDTPGTVLTVLLRDAHKQGRQSAAPDAFAVAEELKALEELPPEEYYPALLNFLNAADIGYAPGMDTPLYHAWKRASDAIADTATDLEMMVRDPRTGRRTPFAQARKENYFPHSFLGQELDTPALVDRMAPDYAKRMGIPLERARNELERFITASGSPRYGQLEMTRLDVPGWNSDPARVGELIGRMEKGETLSRADMGAVRKWGAAVRNDTVSHIEGAWARLEHVRRFGRDNEISDALIGDMRKSGDDADFASLIVDLMGGGPRVGERPTPAWMQMAMNAQVVGRMQFSAVANLTQPIVNVTPIAGARRTLQAYTKLLRKGSREDVLRSGAVPQSVFEDVLRMGAGAAKGGRLSVSARAFLRVTGFTGAEWMNRGVSFLAGREMAADLTADLLRGGKRAIYAARTLRWLGVDPAGVKARGGILQEELTDAGVTLSDKTQFPYSALDLPPGVRANPWARMAFQFKSYIWQQTKFFRDTIFRESRNGNHWPLFYALVGGGAAAEVGSDVRRAMQGFILGSFDALTQQDIRKLGQGIIESFEQRPGNETIRRIMAGEPVSGKDFAALAQRAAQNFALIDAFGFFGNAANRVYNFWGPEPTPRPGKQVAVELGAEVLGPTTAMLTDVVGGTWGLATADTPGGLRAAAKQLSPLVQVAGAQAGPPGVAAGILAREVIRGQRDPKREARARMIRKVDRAFAEKDLTKRQALIREAVAHLKEGGYKDVKGPVREYWDELREEYGGGPAYPFARAAVGRPSGRPSGKPSRR